MDSELEQVHLPTIFGYSAQVYEAMQEEASAEILGAQYGDEEGLVYEGFLTALIRGLDLPTPYYTKIMTELKRMDCVRQLRRGGSTTPSRWLLLQPPTPVLFREMRASAVKPTDWKSGQEQRIRDLNDRLATVEKALGITT